jgi:hypothetical protein
LTFGVQRFLKQRFHIRPQIKIAPSLPEEIVTAPGAYNRRFRDSFCATGAEFFDASD